MIFKKGKKCHIYKEVQQERKQHQGPTKQLSTAVADSQLQFRGIRIMQMVTAWIKQAAALSSTPHSGPRHIFTSGPS